MLGAAALEAPKSVGAGASLFGAVEPNPNKLADGRDAVAGVLSKPCALVPMVLPNMLFCAGCDGAPLLGPFEPKLNTLFCAGEAVWVDAPKAVNMPLVAGVAVLGAEGAVLPKVKGGGAVEAGAGVLERLGAALIVPNRLV